MPYTVFAGAGEWNGAAKRVRRRTAFMVSTLPRRGGS